MNRTDEEQILWVADLIRTWEWKFEPAEVDYALHTLNEIPIDKYPEAWAELRVAIRNNEDMNSPAMKRNLRRTDLAEEGMWWWDPEQW